MPRRALDLGEAGEPILTAQVFRDGSWVPAESDRKAKRFHARCYYRGFDGVRREATATANSRRRAIEALDQRVAERLRRGSGVSADVTMTPTTSLVAAGKMWVSLISRRDSKLAASTVDDYTRTFTRYVDADSCPLRGLTLTQANDPQRLRVFMQQVADRNGTSAAKMLRSVLRGILQLAVDNGVLPASAMLQVRPVKSENGKPRTERDHERALTREERDKIVATAYERAERPNLNPRSTRKAWATADLIAFMAATGARIDEARSVAWDDLNVKTGAVRIPGTKSESSDRIVTLPGWCLRRMKARAKRTGTAGLVFSTPAHEKSSDKPWDQSNSAGAVREVLDAAGFRWAVPHTFRRTVATILNEQGVPINRIADQLGHKDPAMTARVYLGRDYRGDKADLAGLL
jgi:integrase